MRIALICSDRGPCPPVKGGAIQLLISKIAPILARNHQVTVFSISDSKLPDKETIEGVKYVRYSQNSFLKKICNKLKDNPVDVIQLYNRPAWVKPMRKVVPKARILLSLHNTVYDTLKISKKEMKANMKEVDKILTVSRFVKKDTMKKVPQTKGKIEVVHTGADSNEYAPVWSNRGKKWRKEIRKKYNIGEKDSVILFVGRLVSYKGCHLVMKALKKALSKNQKVTLLIVGSKWYADNSKDTYIKNLYKLAKKSANKVVFTSYVPVEKMPKYFAAADLFVCASQWKEPLARVHYEAMAAGLPIITTKRGGNHEVVKHGKNGIVIKNYESSNQFRKAFQQLLSDPKKIEKMGRKGRELAENLYHFDRVADDITSIYTSLLSKR